MYAKIIFKNDKRVEVENLQEIYVGCSRVDAPYDNLLVPGVALTFVGDITICCASDDVLLVVIK